MNKERFNSEIREHIKKENNSYDIFMKDVMGNKLKNKTKEDKKRVISEEIDSISKKMNNLLYADGLNGAAISCLGKMRAALERMKNI